MTREEALARYHLLVLFSWQEEQEFPPTAPGSTFRVISFPLEVGWSDTPALEFYCETSEDTSGWGIRQVCLVQLRLFSPLSPRDLLRPIWDFGGNVAFWLRSPYEIEFWVNGDFFQGPRNRSIYLYNHRWVAFQQ